MAFKQGDSITAIGLNEINNVSQSYSTGDLGSGGMFPYYFYWYCTRPSGDSIGNAMTRNGAWSESHIWLYRLENGYWVEKDHTKAGPDGIFQSTATMEIKSYGEGEYRIYTHSSGSGIIREISNLVNSKISNITGHYLKGMTSMRLRFETEDGRAPIYLSRKEQYITADMLNNREIYAE